MRQDFDTIIIGAGAAGLAAGKHLHQAGREVLVLEAGHRIGGRARTLMVDGDPIDLGCGWLHSGDRNPWTKIAEALGFQIDRSPPPWQKQSFNSKLSPAEQQAFSAALGAMFDRLEKAGTSSPDAPASTLLEPDCKYNPLLQAISGYYNGVPWNEVSIHDFFFYQDDEVNWRVREGYGALIATFAHDVPVLCDCPVSLVEWDSPRVRVVTEKGALNADRVIVAVSSDALAHELVRFEPPLPEKHEVAAALPLGDVEKLFLRVAEPQSLPEDGHLFGAINTAQTGTYHLRPMGRPLIECFFADELARKLNEQEGAAFDFALWELTTHLGASARKMFAPVAQSHWSKTPWIGGAYSHAKPGRADARQILAAPVAEKIFFAGEACSKESFSTAHGAYLTGVAAADAVLRVKA